MNLRNDFSRVLAAAALGLLALTVHADTLTGRVVGISDGDTLTLLDESRKQIAATLTTLATNTYFAVGYIPPKGTVVSVR